MSTDKEPARKATQWQFIREGSSSWSWRKLQVDGGLETVSDQSFQDYAFAVNDAINHGFRPRRDYWLIETEFGVTHFHAGEPPAFVATPAG